MLIGLWMLLSTSTWIGAAMVILGSFYLVYAYRQSPMAHRHT